LADIPDKILDGCKKGKGNDQRKLYDLLSPKMYGLCLQYADNTDDAKDIMQEGFIKVFRKIEQFTGKGSLEGWVRRIMVNTALEKYRSQVIMQPVDEKTAIKNNLIYEETIENISADNIISIIQTLTPKYRMVFNLYAIEGYSHKEIAEKLGISEGTSKSNLSRARVILQDKVNKLFHDSREKIK
jgi:RNA polymerase sigma factor (sigma-70 family)